MKKLYATICGAGLILSSNGPVQAKKLEGPKRRIAVTTFKDKSDHAWYHGASVGDGMADMLATALQKSGRFIVVERRQLASAMEEQRMAAAGAVQAATGAKSGQLIGAAYIVTGSVTEFGIKNAKYGAGHLGSWLPIGGSAALETETALVAMDLRFFDTTTGQVIATERAEASRTSPRLQSEMDKMPSLEVGRQGFDDTIIGKATREAIDEAAALVEKHLESSPWYGRVVKVDGADLFLNTGEEDGRKPGDLFQVVRVGEAMIDPDTGETLGAERTVVGRVRVFSLLGKRLCKAQAVQGTGFRAADIIESVSAD